MATVPMMDKILVSLDICCQNDLQRHQLLRNAIETKHDTSLIVEMQDIQQILSKYQFDHYKLAALSMLVSSTQFVWTKKERRELLDDVCRYFDWGRRDTVQKILAQRDQPSRVENTHVPRGSKSIQCEH